MAVPDVEIIDLTESAPQSPPPPATPVHVRSLRRQKCPRTESTSTEGVPNTPILISDGDDVPSPTISSGSGKKRRTKKKRKKLTQLEKDEVAYDGKDEETTGKVNGAKSNGDAGPHNRQSQQVNAQAPTDATVKKHSSSPPLFYLDDKPDALPEAHLELNNDLDSVARASFSKPDALILPDHVVLDVLQSSEDLVVTEAPMVLESDTDDFIHYADAELNLFARYYEEPKDQNERKAHLVCGQCGAEGDHKQADCPVTVCLTCGAHNEHSTRQCPIIKTCFTCGMKGHINRDCPNKHASRRIMDREYDCARCGSDLHKARECPTLWRMYEYVDDADREATLKSRREKENFPIGQGGEGYIGEDYWCYNCGGEGHLGDDCEVEYRHLDAKEPSAFGSFNTMSGPFADHEYRRSSGRKLRREWELSGNFDDGHGFAGPSDVGKRGRDKERDQMRRREKETRDVEGEDDDWFGNRLQSSSRPRPPLLSTKRKKSNEKMVFDFQDESRFDRDKRRPADRLLDRISSGPVVKEAEQGVKRRGRDRRRSASPRDNHDPAYRMSDGGSKHERERERDRDRERERYYRGSGRDSYRPRKEDRKRDEDRSGRQYYGAYVR